MANAKITYKELHFKIDEEFTEATVVYTSSESDNPIWGGGSKTKRFRPGKSILDILTQDIAKLEFLHW